MQVQKISASDNVNRIIKKSPPSGKVTLCLGQRDFIDYYTHVEIIDGVVEVDKEKLRGVEVVMLTLTGIFRYGRDDAESLGMDFRKELFKCNQQIYPVVRKKKLVLTPFQERVINKLGHERAFPFIVELPRSAPASVSLQVEPGEPGKPCGVDYDLKCYVTDDLNQQINPKDSVSMIIRKLTFAPPKLSGSGTPPSGETVKEFKGNSGKVRLEMSLSREVYYHGDGIDVNVSIQNNSNKTARRIKLTIVQLAEITLHNKTSYRRSVAELESEEGFPLHPGQMSFCRSYQLIPTLNRSRDKIGLALDGKFKYEDTGLASSTIIHSMKDREDLGIIITYLVRAKVVFGIGTNDITLEVPFILSHPSKYSSGEIPPKYEGGVDEEEDGRRKFSGEFESQERESLFHDFGKLCAVESKTTKF